MSHFAILVIGDNIEKQLQPFHEYESTGTKDEYVVWVDETEEKQKEFETETRKMFINFDGEIKCPYDDNFYRYPTPEEKEIMGLGPHGSGGGHGLSWSSRDWNDGKGYTTKIHFIPDDYMEKEFSYKKIYGTLENWLKDYEGYNDENFHNGQIGRWTNPNSKWDWYQIGGRYAGRLFLKDNTDTRNSVKNGDIVKPNFSYGWDQKTKEKLMSQPRTDQALKKDINWGKIHQTKEKYDKAIKFWEMKIEGALPKTEEEKEQIKWDYYKPEYYTKRYTTKETYAQCCSNFTMWGFVRDGKWFEKGSMGWWGCSSETNEEAVKWELEFYDRVIKPLPEDTLLTVVDCHI